MIATISSTEVKRRNNKKDFERLVLLGVIKVENDPE